MLTEKQFPSSSLRQLYIRGWVQISTTASALNADGPRRTWGLGMSPVWNPGETLLVRVLGYTPDMQKPEFYTHSPPSREARGTIAVQRYVTAKQKHSRRKEIRVNKTNGLERIPKSQTEGSEGAHLPPPQSKQRYFLLSKQWFFS